MAPSMEAVSTRVTAWANWRTVLTWVAARKVLGQLLPISVEVFQGITFDLLSVLTSQDVVMGVWDAIAYQHRHHRRESPIIAAGGYGRLAKCIGRFAGTQRSMKYPVSRDMVVAVLRSNTQTLAELRDGLALVVARPRWRACGRVKGRRCRCATRGLTTMRGLEECTAAGRRR